MAEFRIVTEEILDPIEFDNGVTCYIKHEMTAGDHAALENFIVTVNLQLNHQGKSEFNGNATLKMIEINLVKIVYPDGREVKPTAAMIRSLDGDTMKTLYTAIDQRYKNFLGMGALSLIGTPTTGSVEFPEPNHQEKS